MSSATQSALSLPTTQRFGTRRRYLMCPPRYFTVSYSINPWMDPGRPVDTARAMAQWTALAETHRALGHTVELIDPEPGLPDMVFAANAGTVIGGVVLGARFRHAQRSAEAAHYRRWFLTHGGSDTDASTLQAGLSVVMPSVVMPSVVMPSVVMPSVVMPSVVMPSVVMPSVVMPSVVMPSAINEGEGDLAWTGRLLLAGSGFRTEPAAHAEAQEVLGVPVVSLRLVDPHYYHLDTCLLVLDDSPTGPLIAYYPPAFSAGSQRVLARLFPDAVIAGPADAACLGLNGVSDGHSVVLPHEAVDLGRALAARGFEPVFVDVSELRRAGGGPKCCTLELRP